MSEGKAVEVSRRRGPIVPFDAERKAHFLELFRYDPDLGGCKALCAEAIGVSATRVNEQLKRDLEFAEAYQDALQSWIDENLYAVAVKRAREGTVRPIVGGKFRDQVVATERVYSDHLMLALLRAAREEFRDRGLAGGAPGAGSAAGGVMVVPTGPRTIAEWQEGFGELAKGKTGRPDEGAAQ